MKVNALEVSVNGETVDVVGSSDSNHTQVEVYSMDFGFMAPSDDQEFFLSITDLKGSATSGRSSEPHTLRIGDEVTIRVIETEDKTGIEPKKDPLPDFPAMNEYQLADFLKNELLQWYESGADRIQLKLRDGSRPDRIDIVLEVGGAAIQEDMHPVGTWDSVISALKSLKHASDEIAEDDTLGAIRLRMGRESEVVLQPVARPGESIDGELSLVCRLAEDGSDEFQVRRSQWLNGAIPPDGIGAEHTLGLVLSLFLPHQSSTIAEQFSRDGVETLRKAAVAEMTERRKDKGRFEHLAGTVFYEIAPYDTDTSGKVIAQAFEVLNGRRLKRFDKLMESLPDLDKVTFQRLIDAIEIQQGPVNGRSRSITLTRRVDAQQTYGKVVCYRLTNGKPIREVKGFSSHNVSMCEI